MEWLKDLKPLLDLGVTALTLLGGFYIVIRPPEWIRTAVNSHHELAQGVSTLSKAVASSPRREEIQELLIGQEALRRETIETRQELRDTRGELRDLRRVIDGQRG